MMEEKDRMREEEMYESEIADEVYDGVQKDVPEKRSDLFAIVILLAGLLAGSVFVDVAQLLTGQGFSKSALRKADVFETDGKTWVAYKEPAVHLSVLTNEKCEKCNPDDALLFLRQYIPTMVAKKVDIASEEGKNMASHLDIKTLPAFVFDTNLEKTDIYAQAQQVLQKKDNFYLLNTQAMGVPVGEYLEAPAVSDTDIVLGAKEAAVRVVEYCDFSAPQCKAMDANKNQMVREYGEKVAVVFKPIFAPSDARSEMAAHSAMCANEQGKFSEYASMLFANQAQWSKGGESALFVRYAQNARLDAKKFSDCLTAKKYADALAVTQKEMQQFGIADVPTFFVGTEFVSGVVKYETLKQMIDAKLSGSSDAVPTDASSSNDTSTDNASQKPENSSEKNKA